MGLMALFGGGSKAKQPPQTMTRPGAPAPPQDPNAPFGYDPLTGRRRRSVTQGATEYAAAKALEQNTKDAAETLAGTNPVDASRSESANVAAARLEALRTRRRALQGNAGAGGEGRAVGGKYGGRARALIGS